MEKKKKKGKRKKKKEKRKRRRGGRGYINREEGNHENIFHANTSFPFLDGFYFVNG
jgi:hypothetical protein